IFSCDFRRIIKTRRGGAAAQRSTSPPGPGRDCPARPGSTTQRKFINLLKNEGMHEEVILDTS
ncbi:MAG: hypothetical protein Q7W38_07235, partial [Deltaproteobacteria bacterium]|nr:hypothetical protein [Deltaproteobacteria bacterium]